MTSEHSPIGGRDAHAIEEYFRHENARQRSTSGGAITALQTYGISALEDREARAALNRELRREFVAAGYNPAGLPWNLVEVTAKPTSETHAEASYEPDMSAAERRAPVSRRFRKMAERGDYLSVLVLEVYFGTIGTAYAETPLPRIFSLLHLVPAGRQILEVAPAIAPSKHGPRTASDKIRSHCKSRGTASYEACEEIFVRGEAEIYRLYRVVGEAWNAARGGV